MVSGGDGRGGTKSFVHVLFIYNCTRMFSFVGICECLRVLPITVHNVDVVAAVVSLCKKTP